MNNSAGAYNREVYLFLRKKLADELSAEGDSYRKLSQTSKKLRDIFGENEDLYIKQRYLHHLDTIYQKYLEGIDPGLSKELLAQLNAEREDLRKNLMYMDRSSLPDEAVEILREQRIKLIRSAIRGGSLVPSKVLEEYPRGFFNEDFESLSRYGKACHTVFSNRQGRTDKSLLDVYGIRLRRQDGHRVGEEEKNEIKTCLVEIFRAVGDLSGLMRATGLTIIHTGGKHIFRYPRYTQGAYQSRDQSITLGVRDGNGRTILSSFAHELVGHWLDTVSTPPQSWIDALFGSGHPYLREVLHTSFVDASIGGGDSIYPLLILHMNLPDQACPNGLQPSSSSSELWARFAEQYIAEKLAAEGVNEPLSACASASYYNTAGYWAKEHWDGPFAESALEQIRARVWMAERIYGLNGSGSWSSNAAYTRTFPWAKELVGSKGVQ